MARGKLITEWERAMVMKMHAEGAHYTAIAKAINRSAGSIHHWIKKIEAQNFTRAKYGKAYEVPRGYETTERPAPYNPLTDEKPAWLKRGRA